MKVLYNVYRTASTHHSFLLHFVDKRNFFIVFLLVNKYRGEVLITTNVSGRLKSFHLKPTKTVVKIRRWKTRKSLAVSAVDAGTNQIVHINGQSVVYLNPTMIELISLNVLRIQGLIFLVCLSFKFLRSLMRSQPRE